MAIGHFIKEIGRGKDGARSLSREQAADLFGQLLDDGVSELEVGAFSIAMRIKGETTLEMCGFLDATQQRLKKIQTIPTGVFRPAVVIPTYNGARKLPVLTPLLAKLLAREGFPVILHGTATEARRVFTSEVLLELGIQPRDELGPVEGGQVAFVPTVLFHKGLQRLLDVRLVLQLRNPAHSLVKLMLPCEGPQILVTSYTHPAYAVAMEEVLRLRQTTAMLLRGTEGEAVADPRRTPKMTCISHGETGAMQEHQGGTLINLPTLPASCDAISTARYIESVLTGALEVPQPIALQVERIIELANAM